MLIAQHLLTINDRVMKLARQHGQTREFFLLIDQKIQRTSAFPYRQKKDMFSGLSMDQVAPNGRFCQNLL
jgi:hypothetical protein